MRHECRFDGPRPNCEFCGIPYARWMDGPAFDCPGKPAGNTGRHETPSETGLWDRLRADLNNLGAAYGPITEGVSEAVATPEPVDSLVVRCHFCSKVVRVSDFCDCDYGQIAKDSYDKAMRILLPDPTPQKLSESDRNAYFDGIILAARKRREAENNRKAWLDGPAMSKETITDLLERIEGDIVSLAMSRPLDWEPRVGWKSGGEGWE